MPCAKGMPTRKGDTPGSGCRSGCIHRALVLGYRDARDAWERLRESDTPVAGGPGSAGAVVTPMQMEDQEFREAFPPPTFRDWLVAHKRCA